MRQLAGKRCNTAGKADELRKRIPRRRAAFSAIWRPKQTDHMGLKADLIRPQHEEAACQVAVLAAGTLVRLTALNGRSESPAYPQSLHPPPAMRNLPIASRAIATG